MALYGIFQAGNIEAGERPEETLIRELYEARHHREGGMLAPSPSLAFANGIFIC